MKLLWPIANVNINPGPAPSPGSVYVTQWFGEDPIAQRDTWYGNRLVKKGEHVYKVLANMDGHNGIDIAAPLGTPLIGCVLNAEAYIIYQNKDAGYGNTTVVRIIDGDKNYLMLWGHQLKFEPDIEIAWNWNDKSRPFELGKTYGYVNSTGFSTGNHVHWGLQEYDSLGNKLNSNNGFGGSIDLSQFLLRKNEMQVLKVNGEETLVIKNLAGKFYELATSPELYPYVKTILGLPENGGFDSVSRAEVDANLGGQAKAGITFIEK